MVKIGRNERCPCGSGKKYKKCHGTNDDAGHDAATTVPAAVETIGPPTRLAADLWSVFNFGNPNERYQKFLTRGRPPIKQLIESLLLHPVVYVPTEDYLSLAVLVGTLGERPVIEMLDSKRLQFARLRGSLAYIGNGGGLKFYEMGGRNNPSAHCGPADQAIGWALGGLNVAVKDPALTRLALQATHEVVGTQISDAIQAETYKDVLQSEYLRAEFAIRNMRMDHLAGIGPKDVRIYGGPDEPIVGDEIDTLLMLAMANVELKLAERVGATDLATTSPIGHLLKGKRERAGGREAAESFGELREIADIPDVGEAVLAGRVSVAEIIKLAESRDGMAFLTWFHENCRTDTKGTAREYAALLKQVPQVQSVPIKVLRFLATAGIGLIPGGGTIAGPVASAIDSFVLERMVHGASPKYFIEKLSQLADSGKKRS
jgi:hypothetical protein